MQPHVNQSSVDGRNRAKDSNLNYSSCTQRLRHHLISPFVPLLIIKGSVEVDLEEAPLLTEKQKRLAFAKMHVDKPQNLWVNLLGQTRQNWSVLVPVTSVVFDLLLWKCTNKCICAVSYSCVSFFLIPTESRLWFSMGHILFFFFFLNKHEEGKKISN